MVIARIEPEAPHTIIKRVVGTPGDIVCFEPGIVKVNGVPDVRIVEPTYPAEISKDKISTWDLGEDEWFLLGDNKAMMDMSIDSRLYGPVSRKSIKAKAILVCWPLSRWRILDAK